MNTLERGARIPRPESKLPELVALIYVSQLLNPIFEECYAASRKLDTQSILSISGHGPGLPAVRAHAIGQTRVRPSDEKLCSESASSRKTEVLRSGIS